ncbi:MAG: phosphatase [Flavobacteriales bacterium]|nr:phosphatase [Flavobacteriales bacterium]
MRIAIVDLGTNTFNLLVAERDANGTLRVLHSEEVPVFLGKGGIEKGLIAADAFERGLNALERFSATAKQLGAERITGFGTSALRNARNAPAFVSAAKERFGFDIQVIPGDEEAALILEGVRQAVTFTTKPMLVMDIGGGSIEFILATNKALMWKRSFELGVTRLRERFQGTDPLSLEDQLRIGEHLDFHLEPLWAVMDRHWPTTLIGSAGSFDTLAAMVAGTEGRQQNDEEFALPFTHIAFDALKDRLMAMDRAERLLVPGLPEHRVDTIPYALIAVERVLMRGITDLHWSRYALKEGAAARLMG